MGVRIVVVGVALLTGGCGGDGHRAEGRASTTATTSTTAAPASLGPGDLALVVSNQSFEDPAVDLVIAVDGDEVVAQRFDVENQHTHVSFRIPLEPGVHHLRATADSGAVLDETVTTGPEGPLFVALSYWSSTTDQPTGFTVAISTEPFGFG